MASRPAKDGDKPKSPARTPARRRTRGEGSVYRTTRADGERIWRASASVTPPGGKAQKVRGEGATADLAKERLAANVLRFQVRHGLAPAPDAPEPSQPTSASPVVVLTVHGWLNQWLDMQSEDEMSPGTRYGHERSIRNHIAPALGHIALTELTTADVRTFVATTLPAKVHPKDKERRLLGASAIRRIYFVLNSALNDAVKLEYIPSNPANRMDRPPRTNRPSENVEGRTNDATVILTNLEERDDYVRWLLAFYGVRQSEALGLTDDCLVNLEDDATAALDIKQQLGRRYKRHGCGQANLQGDYPCGRTVGRDCPKARGKEGLYLKETKTEAGVRRIPLSGRLLTALRTHLRKQRRFRATDPKFDPLEGMHYLLFTSPTGKPRKHQDDGLAWRTLLKELDIPHMRGHLARHMTVSLLAESGAMPSTIALIVGHSDIAAQEVYTHLNQRVMRAPLQQLEQTLHGGVEEDESTPSDEPAEAEVSRLREQVATLQQEKDRLTSEVSRLEAELTSLRRGHNT